MTIMFLNPYFTDCNALLSGDCFNKSKCGYGYYGPSCGQQCNCTQTRLCDSVKGCINNSETGMYNKISVGVLFARCNERFRERHFNHLLDIYISKIRETIHSFINLIYTVCKLLFLIQLHNMYMQFSERKYFNSNF